LPSSPSTSERPVCRLGDWHVSRLTTILDQALRGGISYNTRFILTR
jgi:hypothetical protein